jgi:lipoprotein NlpI
MIDFPSSLHKSIKTPLFLGLGFLALSAISCSMESSNGNDMQDNGLALMKQIVQPIRDNVKKYKEYWSGDEAGDGKNSDEYLDSYNEYANSVIEQIRLIKNNPDNTQAYLDLVEAIEFQELFNPKANDTSREKALREMTRWLNTAIKKFPNNKELYLKRADIYFDNEQWQKAKADYTHLISMDSGDGIALASRGRVYEKLGLQKKAQQDIKAYQHIQLETADEYFRRGLFYYFRGQFDLAEGDFSKNIDLDLEKGDGYTFRAEIYFVQNRYDESIADYRKMIEIDPVTASFGLSRIGMNYYYQGNYPQAEATFVEALKREPYLWTVVEWVFARHQQGKSSQSALEYMADQFSDEYLEGAVIHLFLDKISPEELLTKKIELSSFTENTELSNTYFYLGKYYAMKGNAEQARTMFNKSIQASKKRFMPGHLFSKKELARLES